MISPFKKETVYIRLFENKIELHYLSTEQQITRKAKENFSNERLLIATVSHAISFIKDMLTEIQGKKLLTPSLVVLLQPMEKIEGGISEVEMMILNDLAMHIGGKYCFIHPTQELLSDADVRRITKTQFPESPEDTSGIPGRSSVDSALFVLILNKNFASKINHYFQ